MDIYNEMKGNGNGLEKIEIILQIIVAGGEIVILENEAKLSLFYARD